MQYGIVPKLRRKLLQELHSNSVCAKYMDEAKEVHKKILKSSFEKYSKVDINEDDTHG